MLIPGQDYSARNGNVIHVYAVEINFAGMRRAMCGEFEPSGQFLSFSELDAVTGRMASQQDGPWDAILPVTEAA